MPHLLVESKESLERHFDQMGVVLQKFVNASAEMKTAKVKINVDWVDSKAVAYLVGNECETIMRNRGRDTPAAPIKDLGKNLWAWLSYREEWLNKEGKKYTFFSSSVTIYFGYKSYKNKPQIFRAEWVGCQPSGSGHPHWQFDVVESLYDSIAKRAKELREILQENSDSEVQEFSLDPSSDVDSLVSKQKISRIHFPSVAAWWKPCPQRNHTHSPEKCLDLLKWLYRSLCYLHSELDRLK